MSALAQDPVSAVPPASSPWQAARARSTALRTDCLREREEALTATSGSAIPAERLELRPSAETCVPCTSSR